VVDALWRAVGLWRVDAGTERACSRVWGSPAPPIQSPSSMQGRRRWYVPAGLSLAPFRDYLQDPEPTYLELDLSTRPAQRAELKALGARYDTQRKRWYVPAGRDVTPFRRWLTIDT